MLSLKGAMFALFASVAINACSPTNHWFVMHALQTQLALQYHECVPLGWDPVPVDGTYYPGYSAELQDKNSWLPALWLGSIQPSDLRQPDGRAAYEVLNELVRVECWSEGKLLQLFATG